MKHNRTCTLLLMTAAAFTGMTGCSGSLFTPKYEQVLQEFATAVQESDYETATGFLTFTNKPKSDEKFSSFAASNLQNLSFEITDTSDESAVKATLHSDTDTYEVVLQPHDDSYNIVADDFLMEYKVQYLAFMKSSHNNFQTNGEYIGDGIKEYTNYVYKTDELTMHHDMILNETSVAPNVKTKIAFDADYSPSEIVSVVNYADSEQSLDEYVTLKDDVIFVDTYGITEEYSQPLALMFSDFIENITSSAMKGRTFSEFCSSNSSYMIADANDLETFYNDYAVAAKQFYQDYDYECEIISWNYDTYYHLGKEYNMSIKVKLVMYDDYDRAVREGNASTFSVSYTAGENEFEICAVE